MSIPSRSWRVRSPFFLIGGLAVLFGAIAYGAVGLAFRRRLPLMRA